MICAIGIEFPPVSAIIGGIVAQEVLKAITAKDEPICNFFTFSSTTGRGTAHRLPDPLIIRTKKHEQQEIILDSDEIEKDAKANDDGNITGHKRPREEVIELD